MSFRSSGSEPDDVPNRRLLSSTQSIIPAARARSNMSTICIFIRYSLSNNYVLSKLRCNLPESERLENIMGSISWKTVLICCTIMICEGIDLVIYGNVIPSLLQDATMSVDKSLAGTIGSLAFAGMFLGGVLAGRVNFSIKSKSIIVVGTLCFSLTTLISGLSFNVLMLGISRFATGVILGVVLPVALSIARKGLRKKRHLSLSASSWLASPSAEPQRLYQSQDWLNSAGEPLL